MVIGRVGFYVINYIHLVFLCICAQRSYIEICQSFFFNLHACSCVNYFDTFSLVFLLESI